MTAEEIDVYLLELNKIGREQKRQNQRTAGRSTGSRTRRGR